MDKMRGCVPSTGVRFAGGSGGRPRAMRWALVSEAVTPAAAKAAKMASTSVNFMVREADERKELCCEDLSGRDTQTFYVVYKSHAIKQVLGPLRHVNYEKDSPACPEERQDLRRNRCQGERMHASYAIDTQIRFKVEVGGAATCRLSNPIGYANRAVRRVKGNLRP